MKSISGIVLATILLRPVAMSQTMDQHKKQTEGEVERVIRELEGRRIRAMIAVDAAVLDQLLADDLTYTHASGHLETKAEFIASVQSGKLKYLSLEPEESRVRVSGDTAIVTGRAAMKVKQAGSGESRFRIRYIDVYLKRNGKWQMVAWQSTRLPDS